MSIIDCDIHPAMASPAALYPWLPARWREHWGEYGTRLRQGLSSSLPYPRMTPAACRLDAAPPKGGPAGSDLDYMRTTHLDPLGIELGVLQPLGALNHQRNLEFATALCSAVNDWQREEWCAKEPRLRASIVLPQDDPAACAREIAKRAQDKAFLQVSLSPRTEQPLGRKQHWPIFQAAVECDLPIGIHVIGYGYHAFTGSGWPSFYLEEYVSNVQAFQAVLTSLVMEGVFEAFPTLRVTLIEGGLAWVPALCWRLDRAWARMRSELPQVKRPPSEYIRQQVWFTTQPIEEPERPGDLVPLLEQVGWDRVLFSTDYPHWDQDDPRYAFKVPLPPGRREQIMAGNARALYRL
jgi:predicted TIM-barrel fold metal-dependent hydrolase